MLATDETTDWKLEALAYPLAAGVQQELTRLLRTEWTSTDYDWREAMEGAYSENLAITSVLARRHGEPLATATIHYARHHPEVAVIGNVLTHRSHRDRGLAGRVIEVALAQARVAGCQVCLLGTARNPHNVYMHHGFAWHDGSVMSRYFGAADFAQHAFAPGQPAAIRAANWGDLPGLTLLAAQPIATVSLDSTRGLISGRYLPVTRCLSNFPVVWYDTAARGGLLAVLAGPENSRVFGFGSATLGTAADRGQMATLEFVTHDHYAAHLPALLAHLLAGCRTREVLRVEAMVPSGDEAKLACLRTAGFAETACRPGALQLTSGPADVIVLCRTL